MKNDLLDNLKELIGALEDKESEKNECRSAFYEDYIGEYVIVRSYGAGVFFGVLLDVIDNYVVKMEKARMIHYWDDHTAAACTDLALYGITENKANAGKNSRVCAPIPERIILQVIEIIPTSKKATKILKDFRVWSENDE